MAAVKVDPNRVREFVDEESFYEWLSEHRDDEPEVWIRIFKVRSGHASITPVQAIDVCLCWGWIDAVRKGLDEVSFLQRYCPRGKKSVWSQINVANVERLIAGFVEMLKQGETFRSQGTPKAAPKKSRSSP